MKAFGMIFLRIGSADNSSYIAVFVAHAFLAPGSDMLAHDLIEGTAVDETVLKLSAGGIGGLHQYENTFFLLFADVDEGFDAVGSEIGVHGSEILIKTGKFLASHLYFPQMAYCVSCGGGADIASLDVADDYQIFFLTIIDGLLESDETFDTELLVHGDLRFHRRDQVINMVDDLFVVLPDGLSGSL